MGKWLACGDKAALYTYMYCILRLQVDPKFKATAAAKAQPGKPDKAQPGRPGNEHLNTSGRIACSRDSEIGVYSRSADVSTPIASATACDQTFVSKYTILQDMLPGCVLWRRTNPVNGQGGGPRSPVVAAGGFREGSRFLIWGHED